MPLKIGVQLPPQATTTADLRRAWREADEAGAESIWVWDPLRAALGRRGRRG